MSDESNGGVVLSAPIFYLLLGAAGFGGAGANGLLGAGLERNAIQACYDTSKAALSITAQHGDALNRLEELLLNRTRYRYTTEDAAKDRGRQATRDTAQDRRLRVMERHVDKRED